ncbi:MAG: DUF2156 domain-containing protein [Bacteroidales bacterium]|nr:DUF2156 domain-containing protein [Bacteroidales bacterium]
MDLFIPLTVSDKNLIGPFLERSGKTGAEYSFATLYMWSAIFHTSYHIVSSAGERILVIKSCKDAATPCHFLYPMGLDQPVEAEKALKILSRLSDGVFFLAGGLSQEEALGLKALDPGNIKIQPVRESYDYVYNASDLLELKGKKLQSKRNHLNAFLKEYPQHRIRAIEETDIPACLEMNDQWCKIMGCLYDLSLGQEACAVHKGFRAFGALGLEGLMITVDGRIIAYTFGEPFLQNTYLVHVEKAFPEYRGAYQVINQAFVKHILEKYPDTLLVNREDDVGNEGLRQAKMSYRPAFLIEKYSALVNLPPRP